MPDNRKPFIFVQQDFVKMVPDPEDPAKWWQNRVSRRKVVSGKSPVDFCEWMGQGSHSFMSLVGPVKIEFMIPLPHANNVEEAFQERERLYPARCKEEEEKAMKQVAEQMAKESKRIVDPTAPARRQMPGMPPADLGRR